jgi:ribosomal protein L37AE/L43A
MKKMYMKEDDDDMEEERCPKCNAWDFHPDPVDEYTNVWICESCGYMEDEEGNEIIIQRLNLAKHNTACKL